MNRRMDINMKPKHSLGSQPRQTVEHKTTAKYKYSPFEGHFNSKLIKQSPNSELPNYDLPPPYPEIQEPTKCTKMSAQQEDVERTTADKDCCTINHGCCTCTSCSVRIPCLSRHPNRCLAFGYTAMMAVLVYFIIRAVFGTKSALPSCMFPALEVIFLTNKQFLLEPIS
jgi:hypothetical protein